MSAPAPTRAEILAGDADERVDWYAGRILPHRELRRVTDEVTSLLRPRRPGQIVIVVGPTGVGKTTLLEELKASLLAAAPPGMLPAVSMECPSPEKGGYEFGRKHWRSLVEAMNDPFPDDHMPPDVAAERRQRGIEWPATGRRSTSDDLRRAAIAMAPLLGVRAVLLDESQHLFSEAGGRSIVMQMDALKSFSNQCDVKHVLFGTSDMFIAGDFKDLNAQLARRTRTVLFDAYRYDHADDRLEFEQVLIQLLRLMPLRERVQASIGRVTGKAARGREPRYRIEKPWLELAFLHSAGCVGILKDLLVSALDEVLSAGRESLALEDLQRECDRLNAGGGLHIIADNVSQWHKIKPEGSLPEARSSLGL
ncbi:MAG: AAA family ATPase [Chloroflexi bacterium]|nr:AAA family ATPase [Chloroflexota bacterium]